MMEFLASINWLTVFITLAVAFIIYNTIQIIRYAIIKRKSEKEIKEIDSKIANLNKELEKTKKAMEEQIKGFQK